jgi:adenylate kinase family enzyme
VTSNGDSVDALLSAERILVLGPCGSGKTHLTRQLSRILDLPAVHLDANFWHHGWISTPQPEWRRMVISLIKRDQWIMDGTYESTLDLRIPAADAIVMLSRSRWSCLWGVVRRSLMYRNRQRPDAPSGQPIDVPYLRYIWRYPTRTEPLVTSLIEKYGPQTPVFRLGNKGSATNLLTALKNARSSARPALTSHDY